MAELITTYSVRVQRSGKFWAVYVPEVDRWTQARRLREIDEMARDLIAVMLDVAPDSFELDIDVVMPDDVAEHLRRAEQLRTTATKAQSDAAAEVRAAALSLQRSGIPLRDLGRLLGVSFQRAGQLTKGG